MHYTISYTNIKDEAERRAKAIADIKDYTGDKNFAKLEGLVKQGAFKSWKDVVFGLEMFMGIKGYPVVAFMEHYLPDLAHAYKAEQDLEHTPDVETV